jgi:hypothetical protein
VLDKIGVPLVASQVASFLGVPFEETNGGVSDARFLNSNI